MTDSIWQSIATTPWWMLPLAIYLLRMCYLNTKPRAIPISHFYLMPVCYVILSIIGMVGMLFVLHALHLGAWLDGLFLGLGLGYWQFSWQNIRANQQTATLHFQGSFVLIIILTLFLILKYYFGFKFVSSTAELSKPFYPLLYTFLFGLVTGLFTGKLAYAKRCLRSGPFC